MTTKNIFYESIFSWAATAKSVAPHFLMQFHGVLRKKDTLKERAFAMEMDDDK